VVATRGVETGIYNNIIDPSLEWQPSERPRIPDRKSYVVDLPRPANTYGIHNNSVNNLRRGLTERVHFTDHLGTKPPSVRKKFHEACAPFLQDLKSYHIPAYSLEQVRDHYKGSKRTRYQQAYDSLSSKPFNPYKDSFLSTFLKAEKIDFSVKKDPAPRVIQPRHPRFNLHFGKYILPLEWKLYKAVGKLYRYPSIAKGFNAEELGDIVSKKWKLFQNPCAVSLDASRFDQHISKEALRFTHSVYKRFNADPEFSELLAQLYTNRGIATAKDGSFFYRTQQGRMSGDMDTALGNCLLMSAMVYSYAKSKGIPHEAIDNGDDITVIMDKEDLGKFTDGFYEWFNELGFTMKIESQSTCLEKLEFCQMTPVRISGKWRFTRLIKSISKDLTFICDPEEIPGRLDMIGTAGLICCDGVPVYNSFYRAIKRIGVPTTRKLNGDNSWTAFWGRGMKSHSKTICESSRVSFYLATGINPTRQVELEEIYDNVTCSMDILENGKSDSHLFEFLDDIELSSLDWGDDQSMMD